MADLSAFPVTKRWPPAHPDRLQLYSFPTPNGVKVSAMLEETGLPYEAHLVNIFADDQKTDEFVSLAPNGKIPAILDPDGPEGAPLGLFESGAILLYLAEKTGKLMPAGAAERWHAIQWLMFQMGGIGPFFGQMGHFYKFAADRITDPYPTERYVNEARRLTSVLNARLQGRDYVMGSDYTIVDIAIWPWVRTALDFYEAGEAIGIDDFPAVEDWLDRCMERPASMAALNIPPRP
ncbi:MAG: glutathione S-transferase [Alphaproteobacteria bacterium]|nr:MAG: glutathione S-transferase [Alphaproteobacteria bacterium]